VKRRKLSKDELHGVVAQYAETVAKVPPSQPASFGARSGVSKTDAAIVPLGERVTLRTPEAPTKIGRFWIPPEAQKDFVVCQAEIVAVGRDVRDRRLQPGLRVISKRFRHTPHDDTTFTVWESDLLAIVDVSLVGNLLL